MADLTYTLGLDDSEFQATLRGSQASVNDAASRVSQLVNQQTSGVRSLVRSFGSVLAIGTGLVGLFSTIGGLVRGVETGLRSVADSGLRARDAAREEARSREAARRAIEQSVSALRASGGGGASDEERINAIYAKRDELLTMIGSRMLINEQVAQAVAAAEKAVNDILAARGRRQQSFLDQTRLEVIRATGDEEAYQFERERLRHQEQLKQIREVAEGNQGVIDELDQAEQRRHDAEMDRIRREAAARRAEDERRAAEERERLERRRFDESFISSSLEEEALRIRGMEKEADILRAQEEARRQIQRIRDAETLTDSEKLALEERVRDNLRAQIDAINAREEATRTTFGSVAAVGLNQDIVAQSLGPGVRGRVETSDRGLTEVARQVLGGVKEIVQRFRQGPAALQQGPGFLT